MVDRRRIYAKKGVLSDNSPVFAKYFENQQKRKQLITISRGDGELFEGISSTYEDVLEFMMAIHPPMKELNGEGIVFPFCFFLLLYYDNTFTAYCGFFQLMHCEVW